MTGWLRSWLRQTSSPAPPKAPPQAVSAREHLFGSPPAPPPAPPPPPAPDRLSTLDDLASLSQPAARPGWDGTALARMVLAPATEARPLRPLLPGTERFAPQWLVDCHAGRIATPAPALACYFARDAVISGGGQLWIDGRLVTARELMPSYLFRAFGLDGAWHPSLLRAAGLPLRTIDTPTVVLQGHGAGVYGHFLIEWLPRLLLARQAMGTEIGDVGYLLARAAPSWLLRILIHHLGVPEDRLEFFDPLTERVQLRRALIPTGVGGSEEGFHPFAGTLIDALLPAIALPRPLHEGKRLFVARRGFVNPVSPRRICRNEDELIDIATRRFGFEMLVPEELPWRGQVSAFRHAAMVAGLWGSAMHTALVAPPGARCAVIGIAALVQSNIAALRAAEIGFLARDLDIQGEFTVDPADFTAFLTAACE